MNKYWLAVVGIFLTFAANAETIQSVALPSASLIKAVETEFPNSTMLAHSTECKSSNEAPAQIGMVLLRNNILHAVIATPTANAWVFSDLPRTVEYEGGAMPDFLDEFNTTDARNHLEVRCTNPQTDPDINIEINGAFIAHRGEQSSAQHICFPASDIYNSWVCYWTKPNTTKPELSFVQFNAD